MDKISRLLSGIVGITVTAMFTTSSHAQLGSHYANYLNLNNDADFWYTLKQDDQRDWFTRHSEPGREVVRSTFRFDRSFDDLRLEWGSAAAEHQRLNQAGIQFGGLGFAAFGGEGKTVSDVSHDWLGAGSFHFHGGIEHDYDFSGYRLGYDFSNRFSLGLTQAAITADGLEDRDASELTLGFGETSVSMLRTTSDGALTGRAFGLNTHIGSVAVSLQHMAAENEATYSALSFARQLDSGHKVSMRLEQRDNPLYDDANDSRVVFSLAYRLRSDGLFRAAETAAADAEPGEEEAEKSKATPILIGAGAVGAAVALGSGGGGGSDNSPRFNSQNASARAILNEVNPRSIAQNREWGGYVFRFSDGTYSYTRAVQGTPTSVSLPAPANAVPRGALATASYHTHAAFDPRYDNENFSPQDILSDIVFGLDGYLGTPRGQFKFHDVSEASIVTLGGPGTLATE